MTRFVMDGVLLWLRFEDDVFENFEFFEPVANEKNCVVSEKVLQKGQRPIFEVRISCPVVVSVQLDVLTGGENHLFRIGNRPVQVNDGVGLRQHSRKEVVDVVYAPHRRGRRGSRRACERCSTSRRFGYALIEPSVVVRGHEDISEGEQTLVQPLPVWVLGTSGGMQ